MAAEVLFADRHRILYGYNTARVVGSVLVSVGARREYPRDLVGGVAEGVAPCQCCHAAHVDTACRGFQVRPEYGVVCLRWFARAIDLIKQHAVCYMVYIVIVKYDCMGKTRVFHDYNIFMSVHVNYQLLVVCVAERHAAHHH